MTQQNQQPSNKQNKWKIGCIATSALSGILLLAILIIAAQPPRVEYKYMYPSSTNSGSSSSDNYNSSSNDDSSSSSSPNSSSTSSYQRPEVITYAAGEKVGTSIKGVTIEIEQVTKNYQNYPTHWEPESGYEYVQVKLNLKNNTGNAISLYYADFYIEDNDGMMDDAQTSHHDNSTSYFPFSKQVTSGAEVSGVMLFEVQKGATDKLTFLYEKDTATKRISIDL